jgi:hypothetical protein
MMKSVVFAAAWLTLAGAACAEGLVVKGVVGGGLTFGGDTLANVQYVDGDVDNAKVHAGGLFALNAGIELQFTDLVSAQALVGYHVDRTNGSNGNVRFERYPVEVLGHFRVNDWFRLGGGARYTANAKVRASGAGQNYAFDEDFKPTWGSVVEGEFFPTSSVGIKLRYVSEKFKSKTYPYLSDVDGSHGGIYVNYYFF